jgi:pSer/pThr/pTyr-binding forkhead associated (FHA) protein
LHCTLAWQGNQITVEDLKSSNGTYLNGVRLPPNQPRPIENGDLILLGKLDVWVYFR